MSTKVRPPFSYVGGKRRLIPLIDQHIPAEYNDYIEPFVGGGAVALHVIQKNPGKKYIISDYNNVVRCTWWAIQNHIDEVIEYSEEHAARHDRRYFLAVRNRDRYGANSANNTAEMAARLMYMCGTGFGGGYNVDKNGHCSNTFGKAEYHPDIENLRNVSKLLNDNDVEIRWGDFRSVLDFMRPADFIYLDPPYATDDDRTGGKDEYAKSESTEKITRAVHEFMEQANDQNTYALMSNNSTPLTEELFEGWQGVETELFRTNVDFYDGDGSTRKERLWANLALSRALAHQPATSPAEASEED